MDELLAEWNNESTLSDKMEWMVERDLRPSIKIKKTLIEVMEEVEEEVERKGGEYFTWSNVDKKPFTLEDVLKIVQE